jgi:transposase
VLFTTSDLPASEVALAYKGLWMVERAFRELKSSLEVRPVYHFTERRVRAHVFICFLAFHLECVMHEHLRASGCQAPYLRVMHDLGKLKAVKLELEGQPRLVRTELEGLAFAAFSALGMMPPSRVIPLS